MVAAALAVGTTSVAATSTAEAAATSVRCPTVNPVTGTVHPRPAPGVDWSGCDLRGADLDNASLARADLSGADLYAANMNNSTLRRANLSGADLQYAAIGSSFLHANLTGANLTGAGGGVLLSMKDADLRSATLTGADLQDSVLSGADLQGSTLGGVNITGVDASGANLTGTDFSGVNITGASLRGANLTHANFSPASADNVNLTGANLTEANLSSAAALISPTSGGLVGVPASLPANWRVAGGWLIGPVHDNLQNADLSGLDLSGSYLAGASLQQSNLTNTNLTDANLSGAQASGASVTGADLTGATLTDFTASGLTGTPVALPANWSLISGFLLGPEVALPAADLAHLDLSGTDLASSYLFGVNLTGANLTNVNFAGANVREAVLTGADITGTVMSPIDMDGVTSGSLTGSPASLATTWMLVDGYLIGPGAHLANANLSGANLTNAQLGGAGLNNADLAGVTLTNAVLSGASVTGANFASANLTGVLMYGIASGSVQGTPATIPANWSLVDGYFVGPHAELQGAALSGADLAGADLVGARLDKADLSGADLAGANLHDTTADYVAMANANLTGANLNGSWLPWASLANATLTDADFTGATLNVATLDGASVTGATWTNTRWYDTVCPDGTNSNLYVAGCFSARDTTPPVAAPAVAFGTAGSNGWYTSELQVNWNWTDDGAINTNACPQWSTGDTNGDPVTLTATCADRAGNVGHASETIKIDMTPPVVTVTGVRTGGVYALGRVPAAGCKTTESVSGVATPAHLSLTGATSHSVGKATATCAGAVSVAGLAQAKAVLVNYTAAYGLDRFLAPGPGASVRKAARHITVRFRLTGASGQSLADGVAIKLATDRDVRVSLAGPGIKRVTATCRWQPANRQFNCLLRIPRGVRIGRSYRYTITAAENVGTGFVTAPAIGRAHDPQVIHFN